MEKRKATVGVSLIYLILLGVMNLLVFTIFKTRTPVFWISYSFMTIAFLIQVGSMFLAFKPSDVETVFFGMPLASFSVFYLIAALAVGVIFMIFQRAGVTLSLVIQILILAAYLVIAIIAILSRDTVQAIGDNVRKNVASLQNTRVDVEMISTMCRDPELKNAVDKLADTIKYSDPMVTPAIQNVEERIGRKMSELRVYVENNQVADAMDACRELELLYVERNKKLAISK